MSNQPQHETSEAIYTEIGSNNASKETPLAFHKFASSLSPFVRLESPYSSSKLFIRHRRPVAKTDHSSMVLNFDDRDAFGTPAHLRISMNIHFVPSAEKKARAVAAVGPNNSKRQQEGGNHVSAVNQNVPPAEFKPLSYSKTSRIPAVVSKCDANVVAVLERGETNSSETDDKESLSFSSPSHYTTKRSNEPLQKEVSPDSNNTTAQMRSSLGAAQDPSLYDGRRRSARVKKVAIPHNVKSLEKNKRGKGKQGNKIEGDQLSSDGTTTIITTIPTAPKTVFKVNIVVKDRKSGSTIDRFCKCKKSRCLKLYCECFSAAVFCDPLACQCNDCSNHEDSPERENAVQNALSKYPDPFVHPQTRIERRRENFMEQGCSCKKSRCLKKYCECFSRGELCRPMCSCSNCKNYKGSRKLNEVINSRPQLQVKSTPEAKFPLVSPLGTAKKAYRTRPLIASTPGVVFRPRTPASTSSFQFTPNNKVLDSTVTPEMVSIEKDDKGRLQKKREYYGGDVGTEYASSKKGKIGVKSSSPLTRRV